MSFLRPKQPTPTSARTVSGYQIVETNFSLPQIRIDWQKQEVLSGPHPVSQLQSNELASLLPQSSKKDDTFTLTRVKSITFSKEDGTTEEWDCTKSQSKAHKANFVVSRAKQAMEYRLGIDAYKKVSTDAYKKASIDAYKKASTGRKKAVVYTVNVDAAKLASHDIIYSQDQLPQSERAQIAELCSPEMRGQPLYTDVVSMVLEEIQVPKTAYLCGLISPTLDAQNKFMVNFTYEDASDAMLTQAENATNEVCEQYKNVLDGIPKYANLINFKVPQVAVCLTRDKDNKLSVKAKAVNLLDANATLDVLRGTSHLSLQSFHSVAPDVARARQKAGEAKAKNPDAAELASRDTPEARAKKALEDDTELARGVKLFGPIQVRPDYTAADANKIHRPTRRGKKD